MQLAYIPVSAASAPIQFTIPNTSLTIKGFASPRAFVQIIDGSALIGTVLADSNGVFEKDFPAMKSGLHNIQISYEDADGITSDPLSQTINIRAQSDTAVEYFLPPTLTARPISFVEGEIVTFSGSTIPNAIVEIVLDGGNLILRPQSDPTGRFSISTNSTGYYFGEHNIVANSTQGGLTSFQTLKKSFIVLPVASGRNVGDLPARSLDPPIIESDNGIIEAISVDQLIRGTAPPNTQIIVYLDGEPIGSTFSSADGNWFFNIKITQPSHEVRAVSCIGAQCSDFSNLVKILYSGKFDQCSTSRLWLLEYRFWGIKQGDGVDLGVSGISGTPPYQFLVDWGDPVSERFNRNNASSLNIHHVYKKTGHYNGRITITDQVGCEYTRYFSSEVIERGLNRWLLFSGLLLMSVLAYALRTRFRVHHRKLILAR